MRYSTNDDGEIECPACEASFDRETFECQIGSETECKACGVTLEVTEIDYSRTLYWSPKDDVRWSEFCRFWVGFGYRASFDAPTVCAGCLCNQRPQGYCPIHAPVGRP